MAEEACNKIVSKYYQLVHSQEMSFKDSIPMGTGVYAIYEGSRALYVGSAKNLNRRLKHDLLGTMGQLAQPHTFGRKLTKRLGDKEKAIKYLRQNCRLRICLNESIQEARVLEQFAILLLKPKYNA